MRDGISDKSRRQMTDAKDLLSTAGTAEDRSCGKYQQTANQDLAEVCRISANGVFACMHSAKLVCVHCVPTWLLSVEARRALGNILLKMFLCLTAFWALAAPKACLKTPTRLPPRDA